mmetsp:Transcript_75590/g.133532  ORF Transcript_75590/g.133532 Transcript_75590/m.133532 type:complete len:98 (-) Transcript_75590:569-862(-)
MRVTETTAQQRTRSRPPDYSMDTYLPGHQTPKGGYIGRSVLRRRVLRGGQQSLQCMCSVVTGGTWGTRFTAPTLLGTTPITFGMCSPGQCVPWAVKD